MPHRLATYHTKSSHAGGITIDKWHRSLEALAFVYGGWQARFCWGGGGVGPIHPFTTATTTIIQKNSSSSQTTDWRRHHPPFFFFNTPPPHNLLLITTITTKTTNRLAPSSYPIF